MESARLAPIARGHPARPGLLRRGPTGRPLFPLAAVATAFTVLQLIVVVPGLGLGWDETVYVSQADPRTPAAFFSAPRARGISFLVAPVTALTASVDALRVYLALLSGLALYLSLRAWRTLLPVPVLALAGALFGGLWITLFYGPQAMPNLWVAFGALFATGCFLRAVRDRGDRRALAGMAAGVAFTALMRPSDALWLAAPLTVVAVGVRPWRRPAVPLVLTAAAAVGCAVWVVEAYTGYGGLLARLNRAGEIQGGMGLHVAFDDHVRALEGRSLCRPCDVPWRHPATAAWWFVTPLLVAGGVAAAVRARRTAVVLVATLAGAALSVPYLVLINYAAPRFLLPAYALLALPAALFVLRGASGVRPRLRPLVAGAVGLALAVHLGVQYAVLQSLVSRSRVTRDAVGRVAAELQRSGVRPPCVVSGAEAVRVAYRAGCASRQTGGHDGSITREGLVRMARRMPVAVLVGGGTPAPSYARGWRKVPLPDLPGLDGYHAYVAPAADRTGPVAGPGGERRR